MEVHRDAGSSRCNLRPKRYSPIKGPKSPKSRVNRKKARIHSEDKAGSANCIGKKSGGDIANLEELSEDEHEDAYDVDSIFRHDPIYAKECQALSEAGLRRFNHNNEKHGVQYELVKAGFAGMGNIGRTVIAHVNFKAKSVSAIDDRIYMMFAQVRRPSNGAYVSMKRIVNFCFVLTEVCDLTEKPYVGGCLHCRGTTVHHPYHGKKRLLTGCCQDDVSWLPSDWRTNLDIPDFPPYDG